MTQLKDPQNGVTVYTYDKLGRELTKTLPNGVKTTHVYNEVGYETLLEERDASGTLLSSYASTYDKVGMKLSVTEKDGSVVSYRYSLTYELAREERTGGGPYLIEYFYDAAGNHLRTLRDGVETTTSTDAANQITRRVGPNGTTNFAYDADGNLKNETAPDGSGKSYFFDSQDRLIAVEVKSAGGVLSHRSEFSYDGMGRLVKSSEFTRSGTTWVKQSERGRVFDGLDTVQERGEANQVVAQLTRDGNIGGILSRKAGTSAAFFSYDGNGNVTTLSDAQGNGVGHYRYDGFGNTLEVTGSSAQENVHRFSTKELHAPSGLYYYGFRFYSPALGRWSNCDPIRELGGINLHQMVGNNLVNLVDFLGLQYAWPMSPSNYGSNYGGDIISKSKLIQKIPPPLSRIPASQLGKVTTSVDAAVNAGKFLGSWTLGLGSTDRYYGPNSTETQEFRKSLGAAYIRQQVASVGYRTIPALNIRTWNGVSTTRAANFTIRQPNNATQLQIGGFEWRAVREGNKMHYIIKNDADLNSFFYHAPDALHIPSYERAGNGFGPMGRIRQTFEWWENVSCPPKKARKKKRKP